MSEPTAIVLLCLLLVVYRLADKALDKFEGLDIGLGHIHISAKGRRDACSTGGA